MNYRNIIGGKTGVRVKTTIYILMLVFLLFVSYKIYFLRVSSLVIMPENQKTFLYDSVSFLKNRHMFFISSQKIGRIIRNINPFLMNIVLKFNFKNKVLTIHTIYDQPVFVFQNYLVSCKKRYPKGENNGLLPTLQLGVSYKMEKRIAQDIKKLFPICLLSTINLSKKGWEIITSNGKIFFLGPVWGKGINTLTQIGPNKIEKIINHEKYQRIYVVSSHSLLLKI